MNTKFVVNVDLSRNYTHQIINTFFPTFLLWILAYATLFIKVEDFTDRIMVTVTSLLVLATLHGSINSELPKTSYFKYIDLWFLWYLTNIFCIIIYHIILDKVEIKNGKIVLINLQKPLTAHRTTIRSNRARVNNIAVAILPVSTLIFNLVYFLS